jgi:hypothetical protein
VTLEDATVHAIHRAIHDLLTDFEDQLAPFDAMAARVANFVAERTAGQEQSARRVVQEIELREREGASRRLADEEVGGGCAPTSGCLRRSARCSSGHG